MILPFGQDRALLGRLHAAALPELKRRLSLRRAAGSAVSSGAGPTSRRMVVARLDLGRSGYGHWGGGVPLTVRTDVCGHRPNQA